MIKGSHNGRCEDVVMASQIWITGLVITVLVIGAVDLKPGTPAYQGKIEQNLAHVRNHEKEVKG
jgi:hypothetical protein